ncbi:MAG: competence/damage-inducible protein A, partial [Bacteroidota bacterium]|nr:competence/damage-inducible protein A [Bacteroidota bacterium]
MKAVIINIGDEILIGQVVNTNAAWLGNELNKIGITVDKTIVIRDREDDIHQALDEALKTASVVIMTGGIGPTNDDITKESLCSYFDTRLVFSDEMYSEVEAFVKKRGLEVNKNNLEQAYVPENCTMLPNKIGTAAGMKFKQGNSVL